MIPKGTLRKRCSCCHTLILVAAYASNDSRVMLNGYWVTSMDEDFKTHNRGFLCEPCLDRLCFEKNLVGFGGFGTEEERFENCEVTLFTGWTWDIIREGWAWGTKTMTECKCEFLIKRWVSGPKNTGNFHIQLIRPCEIGWPCGKPDRVEVV